MSKTSTGCPAIAVPSEARAQVGQGPGDEGPGRQEQHRAQRQPARDALPHQVLPVDQLGRPFRGRTRCLAVRRRELPPGLAPADRAEAVVAGGERLVRAQQGKQPALEVRLVQRDPVKLPEIGRLNPKLRQIRVGEDRPRAEVEPALVEGLAIPAVRDVAAVIDLLHQRAVGERPADLHLAEGVDLVDADARADPLADRDRPVDLRLVAARVGVPTDAERIDGREHGLRHAVEQRPVGADLDLAGDAALAHGDDVAEDVAVQQRLATDEAEAEDPDYLRQGLKIFLEPLERRFLAGQVWREMAALVAAVVAVVSKVVLDLQAADLVAFDPDKRHDSVHPRDNGPPQRADNFSSDVGSLPQPLVMTYQLRHVLLTSPVRLRNPPVRGLMYLYVMGRAHCGSTILGIVLGGGAAIMSVGELVWGLERYAGGEPCSCGPLMHECPFWTDVRRRFEAEGFGWDELARRSRDQTDVRSWPATWLAGPSDPEGRRLAALTRGLLRAAPHASGKPHLLDSNKETTRGLFLLKYLPEARVIHLVRNPRAVQQSYYWRIRAGRGFHFRRRKLGVGRTTAPFLVLLGALSWTVGSALGDLAARVAPDRVLRLRYEDLCRDPAAAVRAVGTAFGVPVEDVAAGLERGEAFRVGHN